MRSATVQMLLRSWSRGCFKPTMAYYRVLIRGFWNPPFGDHAGFFTTRTAMAVNIEEAKVTALATLEREWTEAPFFVQGNEGLSLTVVDAWRIGRFRAWRSGSGGHSFFTEDVEGDAARLEAEAANAPSGSNIWQLATPRGQSDAQFYVFEPDD